ncbi:MAG TPA: GHMP kinase [Verrucomicrobiota bacterium]|nr:GHMP kinase [Verrucomicrobiota bacterium]HRZ38981.1 GHMP kinase [Candidatus Paceibacterota bacterium]
MIISRTPLRMSFVGGGSDLPAYYRLHGGAVVSTAINKYVYVTVNPKFDDNIRVSYSRTEEVDEVARLQHPLVRESLRHLDIAGGVEITSIADIPSRGTGLGSSSAFTVGLLHALHAWRGRYRSAEQLARESCLIEIERCGEPIGKQDQYAAAFGGFNFIEFSPDERVVVQPILCRHETLERLQDNLVAFYTGITRPAAKVLREKQRRIAAEADKQAVLGRMVDLARTLRDELQNNNLDAFGELIHQNWVLKKQLSDDVSTGQIDAWYDAARGAGAVGGKILGAGSGGFLLFYAPRRRHRAIRDALGELRPIPMRFEPQGSRIIFVH